MNPSDPLIPAKRPADNPDDHYHQHALPPMTSHAQPHPHFYTHSPHLPVPVGPPAHIAPYARHLAHPHSRGGVSLGRPMGPPTPTHPVHALELSPIGPMIGPLGQAQGNMHKRGSDMRAEFAGFPGHTHSMQPGSPGGQPVLDTAVPSPFHFSARQPRPVSPVPSYKKSRKFTPLSNQYQLVSSTTVTSTNNTNNKPAVPSSSSPTPRLRTGQACDRCKNRKIRCDHSPTGCAQCAAANHPCTMTNRNSGRREPRGYTAYLESLIAGLQKRYAAAQEVLADLGVEVYKEPELMVAVGVGGAMEVASVDVWREGKGPEEGSWRGVNGLWIRESNTTTAATMVKSRSPGLSRPGSSSTGPLQQHLEEKKVSVSTLLPLKFIVDPTLSHLGASMDFAPLSSVSGTSLQILGTTISTGSFHHRDYDEKAHNQELFTPRNNKSVQAILQTIMNANQVKWVKLPPRSDMWVYAQWFFYRQHRSLPILHEPSFFAMLQRVYDDATYTPRTSEIVLIHTIYATQLFHYGVRHTSTPHLRDAFNTESNAHYHFALSHFYQLLCERSLETCQAMTLLALHARNFPKPHGAVILVTQALGRAWSLGLHRENKKCGILEHELRNRLWWAIAVLNVQVEADMGRSMPFTNQDYTTHFPRPVPDEALTANGIDEGKACGECAFWPGLAEMRITPLFIDLYSHLYSPKRNPAIYEPLVATLEARLQAWKSSLPTYLTLPEISEHVDPLPLLRIQHLELVFRFRLRHPTMSMAPSPALATANETIVESLATKMLSVARRLKDLGALDPTWASMALYGAFMFTTLSAAWSRRSQTDLAAVAEFRRIMDEWLSIIQAIATLLEAGEHAVGKMRTIVEKTILQIEETARSRSISESGSGTATANRSEAYLFLQRTGVSSSPERESPGPLRETFPSTHILMPAHPPDLGYEEAEEDEETTSIWKDWSAAMTDDLREIEKDWFGPTMGSEGNNNNNSNNNTKSHDIVTI